MRLDAMAFSAGETPQEFDLALPRHAPVDDEAFRLAMSHFATGVTVVTTRDASGVPSGFTASSFTSLSRAPALVLVCLARSARNYASFVDAPEFAISVLGAQQELLARLFASRGADKFAGDHIVKGSTGLPLVRDALVTFECTLETVTSGGDHVILIGRPWAAHTRGGQPLLNFGSRLHGCGLPDHH